MKRRTLDIMFSTGGMALAFLLLIMGTVLTSNANFAKTYVHKQLAEQQITFKPKSALTAEEAKQACLVKYAGQKLTSGKQAECYANNFVGLHLESIAGGRTYAQIGEDQTALKAQIADAQKANSPTVPALQQKLADLTTSRTTVFQGETIRGLLLTSYGFSVFGVKGSQVATVAYIVAGLLFLLSIAGFVHAFRTPVTETFAKPERVQHRYVRKERVDA